MSYFQIKFNADLSHCHYVQYVYLEIDQSTKMVKYTGLQEEGVWYGYHASSSQAE